MFSFIEKKYLRIMHKSCGILRRFFATMCAKCAIIFVVSTFFLFFQNALFCDVWSTPVDLSAVGQDASVTQVAMNDSGEVVAVWVRNNIIQASTLIFGGSWSTVVDLSASEDMSTVSQIAINDSGQAVAIWRRKSGVSYDIQASTLTFGGSWSVPVSLSAQGDDVATPKVVINSSGQTVAVWSRNEGTDYLVESATLTFGGSWSASVALSDSGADASIPGVAINDSGQMVAVWIRGDVVQAKTCTFGNSWSSVVDLSIYSSVSSQNVFIDSSGKIRVSWQRLSAQYPNKYVHEMASLTFGGSWISPIILAEKKQSGKEPVVVMNDGNQGVAVWDQLINSNTIIQASTYCYTRGWSEEASDLSQQGQDANDFQVVLNTLKQVVVVWNRSNGTNTIIQATTTTVSSDD